VGCGEHVRLPAGDGTDPMIVSPARHVSATFPGVAFWTQRPASRLLRCAAEACWPHQAGEVAHHTAERGSLALLLMRGEPRLAGIQRHGIVDTNTGATNCISDMREADFTYKMPSHS
jgi:hypothetical protein